MFVEQQILVASDDWNHQLGRNGISSEQYCDELAEMVRVFHEILLREEREDGFGLFGFFNKEHQEGEDSVLEGGYFLLGGAGFALLAEVGDGLVTLEDGDVLDDLVFLHHLYIL